MRTAALLALTALLPLALIAQTDVPITVNVRVTDADGRAVIGLGAEDFQLWDNGAEQRILDFSKEPAPAAIGILLDVTRALEANGAKPVRNVPIETAINLLQPTTSEDEFFLVTFRQDPVIDVEYTTDTRLLRESLLSYYRPPNSRGGLMDAMKLGLDYLQWSRKSRKALIGITNGDGTLRFKSEKEHANLMRTSYVQLFYINTSSLRELQPERNRLEAGKIINAIKNQYVLTYRSNASRDGKWHDIRVRVKSSHDLATSTVTARPGYYAGW